MLQPVGNCLARSNLQASQFGYFLQVSVVIDEMLLGRAGKSSFESKKSASNNKIRPSGCGAKPQLEANTPLW